MELCLHCLDRDNFKSKSNPWTGPEGSRSLRLPDFKTIGTEGGQVVSPTHRLPLPSRKYSWYSFLLETESNPGRQCGQKDCVNEIRITLGFIIREEYLAYLKLRASAATFLCQLFLSCFFCFVRNRVTRPQSTTLRWFPFEERQFFDDEHTIVN